MSHTDPDGYYRLLGVAPHASAFAIHRALTKRAKAVDPEHSRKMGAQMQSDALAEAKRVLSNPETRARYDVDGLIQGSSPLPCGRCRQVSAQLRYVVFEQVIGLGIRAFRDRVQGIYCPRCARDIGIVASLITWGIGWWGLPDGPIASVRAIWKNATGGVRPRAANAVLLSHQANALKKSGKIDLARAVAVNALAYEPEKKTATALRKLVQEGEGNVPALKRMWRPSGAVILVHLGPLWLLLAVLILVGVRAGAESGVQAPPTEAAPTTAPANPGG